MNSNLWRLKIEDIIKGAALAVIVAVLGGAQQLFLAHGFDFAAYDWRMILDLATTAFVAYLGKNFASDQTGAIFGKIGGAR